MKQEFELTPDQQEAFDEIKDWLYSEEGGNNFKTLSGFAGTGKTTLLDYIVHYATGTREEGNTRKKLKTMVTATTNKAVKVLQDKVEANSFGTIHSVLGIKAKRRGTLEIFEPDSYNDSQITDYDFVIIDEASMISSEDTEVSTSLLTIILQQCEFSDTKVLFCGDPAQLQPINETVSKCFDFSPVTLTTIVRHDDGIAKVAEKLRLRKTPTKNGELLSPPDVVDISTKDIPPLFKDWRETPDNYRLLTWRNVSVDKWNRILRAADYNDKKLPSFCIGDVVIANEPCFEERERQEYLIMRNSEEGEVLEVRESKTADILIVRTESGRKSRLQVVKKSYEQKLQRQLQEYASTREWHKYWSLKKSYHSIKHCYALTTHKSQGSTFQNVIVDTKDMSLNRDVENRNQLLYVAITRAAKRVYLL